MSAAADLPDALAADRARALTLTPVSRETLQRLDRFVALLLAWQERINLIAPSTVRHLWTRHIADSLQLLDLAPRALSWIDLGSGGGFPGLVLAAAGRERPGFSIDLVESNGKKAAFLREAARLLDIPAHVHPVRIEDVDSRPPLVQVVTARALAPLKELIGSALPLLRPDGIMLFPKGQDVERELTDATKSWTFASVELLPSRSDTHGRIARLAGATPLQPKREPV